MSSLRIHVMNYANFGVSHVLRGQALLKESKDQKPVMDKLNELSSSLLDLIPWHTRVGLEKLVAEDNERYAAARDTCIQQVEQINADILRSQQVTAHLAFLVSFKFSSSKYPFVVHSSRNIYRRCKKDFRLVPV